MTVGKSQGGKIPNSGLEMSSPQTNGVTVTSYTSHTNVIAENLCSKTKLATL